jgi:hypothetical protein
MATAKRSRLDELADTVEDVTDIAARQAGHSLTDMDAEALAREREAKIDLIMRERQVPRPVAVIMADRGYSKGTATRIILDEAKRKAREREAAHAAAQARSAKQPSAVAAV